MLFSYTTVGYIRSHKKTPYEAWYDTQPNIQKLRMFGAQVCAKRSGSGKRQAKLNKHSFRGIFIGYLATMADMRYIDLRSGLVKTYGHATSDEVWYSIPNRPSATQLPYDLGPRMKLEPPGEINTRDKGCDRKPPLPT